MDSYFTYVYVLVPSLALFSPLAMHFGKNIGGGKARDHYAQDIAALESSLKIAHGYRTPHLKRVYIHSGEGRKTESYLFWKKKKNSRSEHAQILKNRPHKTFSRYSLLA